MNKGNQKTPISVLIPTRNEELNLPNCLEQLHGWADEIVVVDSGSTDRTIEIAEKAGANLLFFDYKGGWPKKRQWALDTYRFGNEWILMLDADEVLQCENKQQIEKAIRSVAYDGFWMKFRLHFLGRSLRYGGFDLWKLCLFRLGKGSYERRIGSRQTLAMSDIEVHEHVIVDGRVGWLSAPVRHENWNSLHRYIAKHNEYSDWEAMVYSEGGAVGGVEPRLFGTQAERRRWIKKYFFALPGFPLLTFFYHYVFRLGFLDGRAGFIYCILKGVQRFHAKAKWHELKKKDL